MLDPVTGPLDERLYRTATEFLKLAFKKARADGIIPRRSPRNRWERDDGPWPPYYACWDIARGDISEPLTAVLREVYPARFGEPSKRYHLDPEKYITALLRGAIAATVVEGDRLTAKSRPCRSIIRELDKVASADGQRFASLWVVSDLELEDVNDETIGDVRLLGSRGAPYEMRWARERLVASLLPEALWVSEHDYPTPTGSSSQGVLYASGIGQEDHWPVTKAFNDQIGRLVAVFQLATAMTGRPQIVWAGEPSMIHVEQPEANPQPAEFMESYFRRVGTVTPDQLPGLRRLTSLVASLEEKKGKAPVPSVMVAIWRYTKSFRSSSWRDTVLDLATALEACLSQGGNEAIGLTLRTRAAHLLAHDDSEQADEIYTDVEDLYTLRSDIIHGNTSTHTDMPALWKARGYEHIFETDRIHVLLDRWREIVRRSIAARLMLGDEGLGSPLWPFRKPEVKVDRLLVRRDCRDSWRERIVSGAAEFGLPLLADHAPPLFDYLDARREREAQAAKAPVGK